MSLLPYIFLLVVAVGCVLLVLSVVSEFFVLMFELANEKRIEKRKKVAFEHQVKSGIIK